ncbi:MAG TPA: YCF48-related protein [Ignavibacteria bacterium]|nr:YCF48-related protein [Ignavibacteria bacterium]
MKRIKITKIKTFITAFVMILTGTLHAQLADNWDWMNPKPQGNTINAIDFVNDNLGFAVGEYGTILKTTNGGVTWQKQNSGTSTQFISLDFVDQNTGYAGGTNQMLKKTTNGGQSWQDLTLPTAANYYVMDIKFISAPVGYVLGFFLDANKIWKTTDGGATWETQLPSGTNYLVNLYFLNENSGFASGGALVGEISRTTNGGASWQLVQNIDYEVKSITFINLSTGYAGCVDGRMYKSVNGGNTWSSCWSNASIDVKSVSFIDANTGFGFGTGSVFVKTTNGGTNWYELPISVGSIRQYYDAEITPNGTIHAAGTYGAMIRSTNSGSTFQSAPIVTEGYLADIEFINNTTGYAVTGFSYGDILKTTNSGSTWVSQLPSSTTPIYGISFTNAETGYLAGSIKLYKTTNGGTNWTAVYTSTTNEIFADIFFTDINTGYAVGSYGRLLKTTNAGADWSASVISVPGTLLGSVFFVNSNTGFVVGDNNSTSRTTDAGASWNTMTVASGLVNYNNIFFTDANTGYIASNSGVYKTTTGGNSWFHTGTPGGGYSKVQFRGNFGYAIAGDGKIIKSTNAGASWIVQPTVTNNPLYALYFNSDNFVYAGGLLGTMIKTMPEELVLTPVSGNSNETPKSFYLSQNFPNPFNPATTIKFGLTKLQTVSLTIYDITGRSVEQLINSNLNSGTHEIKWDASKYSSGIYFYTLRTNDFSETKRMMLVK